VQAGFGSLATPWIMSIHGRNDHVARLLLAGAHGASAGTPMRRSSRIASIRGEAVSVMRRCARWRMAEP
jgi:hypothetical protein